MYKKFYSTLFLVIIALFAPTFIAQAEEVGFDFNWGYGYYFSNAGVCISPDKGTGEAPSFRTSGSTNYIIFHGGNTLTVDAGIVNIRSVVIQLGSSSGPYLTTVTTDGLGDADVKASPDWTATWTNPGTNVYSITFNVGEKATMGTNPNNDGMLYVSAIYVEIDGQEGLCGVGLPSDTIHMDGCSILFADNSQPDMEIWQYQIDAVNHENGCIVQLSFETDERYAYEDIDDVRGIVIDAQGQECRLEYISLQVKKNATNKDLYDISFVVISDNAIMYELSNWTGSLNLVDPAFEMEPAEATNVNFNSNYGEYYSYYINYGQLDVDLYDDNNRILQLTFNTRVIDPETVVTPGTYNIDLSGVIGTVLASQGYTTYSDEGSILYTYIDVDDVLEPVEAYFLESGTVVVEKMADGVRITVDATSHNGSTIHGMYEGQLGVLPSALQNVSNSTGLDVNKPMFNVLGTKVTATYRGIVIQDGCKYMLR